MSWVNKTLHLPAHALANFRTLCGEQDPWSNATQELDWMACLMTCLTNNGQSWAHLLSTQSINFYWEKRQSRTYWGSVTSFQWEPSKFVKWQSGAHAGVWSNFNFKKKINTLKDFCKVKEQMGRGIYVPPKYKKLFEWNIIPSFYVPAQMNNSAPRFIRGTLVTVQFRDPYFWWGCFKVRDLAEICWVEKKRAHERNAKSLYIWAAGGGRKKMYLTFIFRVGSF